MKMFIKYYVDSKALTTFLASNYMFKIRNKNTDTNKGEIMKSPGIVLVR